MFSTLLWADFRAAVANLQSQIGYAALTLTEQRVLEQVLKREELLKPTFVGDLAHDRDIASPAVVHSAITRLIREGFLASKSDPEDTRRRLLRTTPKARKMFALLEAEAVALAARMRGRAR
jgi:DNA-binding MarR family transcriptional regulator